MLQKLHDFWKRLNLKTLAFAALTILVGVLDIFDVIDLQAIVSIFVEDDVRAGQIVAVLGLAFMLLRFITKSAVLCPKDDE